MSRSGDRSLHISTLLILLCVGVVCGLVYFAFVDHEVGAVDVSARETAPVRSKETPIPSHKMAGTPFFRSALPMASPMKPEEKKDLVAHEERSTPAVNLAELASEKNQVMDELLNQPQIPSDYADVMIGLYRDKSQDVLTRDFAVQHIGLYVQALDRRGEYDADAAESRKLRAALFDAAAETRTIVAAAAFRALADMAAFDDSIDARRLDSLLAACVCDESSAPAARSMAVQICGERRVRSSISALETIRDNPSAPEILHRSAAHSLLLISGQQQ